MAVDWVFSTSLLEGGDPPVLVRTYLWVKIFLDVYGHWRMTHRTLGDRLGTYGSTGWVGHDLDGFRVRNQKSGYKPEDTVPTIHLGF